MRFLHHIVFCTFLLFTIFATRAQVSFGIQASSSQIFKNDVLQVEYAIHNANAISDFMPPVFSGWTLVSGPMITQEESVINGKSSHKNSYLYTLAPAKSGKLTVPATTVVTDGKKLSCSAVQITVFNKENPSQVHSPPPSSPQLPSLFGEETINNSFSQAPVLKHNDNPATIMRSNMRLKVTPSKTRCYVGEPVMVTYQFYTALPSNPTAGKPPYFSGCSVTEIPFDQQFLTEKIDGKEYRVVTLRKVQLIPLQAGPLSLGESDIENEVSFRVEDQQYRSQPYKLTVKNAAASIEVLPLPAKQPASFTGVVGDFTITAQPKSSTLPAQENNSLVITIHGKGNLARIIAPPAVDWPAGTEHYESTSKEEINNAVFPFEGYRSFEIPFIATKEGKLTIPPVRFTYFDPNKQAFATVHTDSIPLHFTKATGKSYRDDPAFSEDRTTRQYIWIVPALAVVVISILLLNNRQEKQKKALAAAMPAPVIPVVKTDFQAAVQLLAHIEDHPLFFNKCKELLSQALAESTQLPATSPVPALLAALTTNIPGDHAALATDCRSFYSGCDLALYAPAGQHAEREKTIEALQQLLLKIKDI